MSYTPVEERRAFHEEVLKTFKGFLEKNDKEWAKPEEPILHTLKNEKEEPHVYFHNNNYRIGRKFIHFEKLKMYEDQVEICMKSNGEARFRKCQEIAKRFQAAARVASNIERGPQARKRDVGFIYHNNKLRELEKDAKEYGIPNPFPPSTPRSTQGY